MSLCVSRIRLRLACLLLLAVAGCGLVTPGTTPEDAPRLLSPFRETALVVSAARSSLAPPGPAQRPAAVEVSPMAWRDGTITWLGHASLLVRQAGQSILIDPVLDTSDEGWIALLRRVGTPADPSGLDRLDAVLITHDHHDHFDISSLAMLTARFPEARLILPRDAALRAALPFASVARVDPWQDLRIGALHVTALPVVHHGSSPAFAGVGPRSLALGYALRGGGRAVLAAGDTGLGPVFNEIGARLGPFDLAMVPIAPGDPASVFGHMHASPEDAVTIATRLRARRAMPIHWGMFPVIRVPHGPVVDRFVTAGQAADMPTIVLPVGGTVPIRP